MSTSVLAGEKEKIKSPNVKKQKHPPAFAYSRTPILKCKRWYHQKTEQNVFSLSSQDLLASKARYQRPSSLLSYCQVLGRPCMSIYISCPRQGKSAMLDLDYGLALLSCFLVCVDSSLVMPHFSTPVYGNLSICLECCPQRKDPSHYRLHRSVPQWACCS